MDDKEKGRSCRLVGSLKSSQKVESRQSSQNAGSLQRSLTHNNFVNLASTRDEH